MLETKDPMEREDADYNLKASTAKVGQLYPVLKAADGEILDGVHRIQEDPSWKTVVLQDVDTDEKKTIVRLVANFHRRQIGSEEKAGWINSLAAIYQKTGLKVEGKRRRAQGPNQIVERICTATGLARRTVMHYLAPDFKQQAWARPDPSQHEVRSSPTQILFNALADRDPAWAQRVIDRFKVEHESELLQSPIFRKKVLDALAPARAKPVRSYESVDPEQIRALMDLPLGPESDEDNIERGRRLFKALHATTGKREKAQDTQGWEPVPALYEVFMQECPSCQCPKCPHANSCIERVRPDD